MGTPKETQTADGLCPRQILGAPPQAREPPCSHPPHGVPQKPFPKRFLRSFFLKKATLRAAAPPAPQRPRARRRPPAKSKFETKKSTIWNYRALSFKSFCKNVKESRKKALKIVKTPIDKPAPKVYHKKVFFRAFILFYIIRKALLCSNVIFPCFARNFRATISNPFLPT